MRVVWFVLLLGAGAAIGVAAVAVHQRWWGVALAVGAVVATVLALPPGWWSRLSFALGFMAVLGVAMTPRAEGDYLIPGNVRGYLLLAVGLAAFLIAVGTLPRPGRST
jgi:hypothetical protein